MAAPGTAPHPRWPRGGGARRLAVCRAVRGHRGRAAPAVTRPPRRSGGTGGRSRIAPTGDTGAPPGATPNMAAALPRLSLPLPREEGVSPRESSARRSGRHGAEWRPRAGPCPGPGEQQGPRWGGRAREGPRFGPAAAQGLRGQRRRERGGLPGRGGPRRASSRACPWVPVPRGGAGVRAVPVPGGAGVRGSLWVPVSGSSSPAWAPPSPGAAQGQPVRRLRFLARPSGPGPASPAVPVPWRSGPGLWSREASPCPAYSEPGLPGPWLVSVRAGFPFIHPFPGPGRCHRAGREGGSVRRSQMGVTGLARGSYTHPGGFSVLPIGTSPGWGVGFRCRARFGGGSSKSWPNPSGARRGPGVTPSFGCQEICVELKYPRAFPKHFVPGMAPEPFAPRGSQKGPWNAEGGM